MNLSFSIAIIVRDFSRYVDTWRDLDDHRYTYLYLLKHYNLNIIYVVYENK